MNPNTTGDVVDEDAAVLQFPKGWHRQANAEKNHAQRKDCFICTIELEEPYIRCAECDNVEICPSCFAQGAELKPHENNHSYIVLQDEFPLFEQHWSARDEERLLNAILECGYGNWEDVSRYLITHTAEDCEKHYVETYIEHRPTAKLPQFKESLLSYYSTPLWAFRTQDMDEPPRHASGTFQHRTMAGYNAARGDFDIELDNDAEVALSEVSADACHPSDPDYELMSALQVAIVNGYNEQLAERRRRQKVVHNHGLIALQKTISWMHRFELTITRPTAEKLTFLMQLLSGYEFEMLYEGLHAHGQAERLFATLQEFRNNGLTNLQSSQLYTMLKARREERNKIKKVFPITPALDWRTLTPLASSSRRSAGPLDIFGLPGFERLAPQEKELCRTVRIVPESYLEFKHLLQTESKRHGSLKLAQARALIKIDVNKTRKLYDFLVKEGYINQSIQVTKEISEEP